MKKALVVFVLFATLMSLFAVSVSATDAVSEESVVSEDAASVTVSSEELTESGEETNGAISFSFSTQRFSTALKHMAVGMIGVIIVLALIAIVVFFLNNITKS